MLLDTNSTNSLDPNIAAAIAGAIATAFGIFFAWIKKKLGVIDATQKQHAETLQEHSDKLNA